MSRQTPFSDGEYFHVLNRGTNKMPIFNDQKDYERFVKNLYLANSKETLKYSDINENTIWDIPRGETLVDIGAWVLMPNHFHLVIKSKNPEFTSLFLQRILISHSRYFNTKNNRSGVLFQGKSKSEHLNTDPYLKYMFSYVHLNPIKLVDTNWKTDGLKNKEGSLIFLNNYRYSSFLDYSGVERNENKILNREVFPEYFTNPKENFEEIVEWLDFNQNE